MSDQDVWFTSLYSAIEREFLHATLNKRQIEPPVQALQDPHKKIRVANFKPHCDAFLSMSGCPLTPAICPFSHEHAKQLAVALKNKIQKRMVAKGLVPDPSKF
jgi:hypothetical protein